MMSFNGHESQPGFDRIEVVDIDPTIPSSGIFNYFEIDFPLEKNVVSMTWEQAQAKITVSEANPHRCQQCHGLPARPIFQAYPSWIGAFGSRHIDPLSDEERTGLKQFINAHSNNKQSRYRHLNPSRFSPEDGQNYSSGPTTVNSPISFSGGALPVSMNTDLSNYNGVRMARVIKSAPIYPYFRYAIVGAFEGCPAPTSFFPAPVLNYLKTNVQDQFNIKPTNEAKLNKIFGKIQSDGESQFGIYPRLGSSVNATIQNHRLAFDNDHGLFAIWLDTMARQGFDRIATPAVPLRVIFEGMGYSMNRWWADLQQPTYRFNSGFGQPWSRFLFVEDPDMKNIFVDTGLAAAEGAYDSKKSKEAKILFCQRLAKQSVETLKAVDIRKLKIMPSTPASELPTNASYPQVFQTTCIKCHSDGTIGPQIPFQNKTDMSNWLRNTKNLQRIKYKLSSAPEVERMPPTRVLTDTEREQLQVFLKTFEK